MRLLLLILALFTICPLYVLYYAFDGIKDDSSFQRKRVFYGFQLDAAKCYVLGRLAASDHNKLWNVEDQAEEFSKIFPCKVSYFPNKDGKILYTPAQYTPQLCCLMLYSAKLSPFVFLRLWLALIAFLPLLLFVIIIRRLHKFSTLECVLWVILAFEFEPYYLNLIPGQTGGMVAAFLALFFYMYKERKDFLAAISLLLIAILKPHYILAPLTMLFMTKRFRSLFYFISLSFASILLSEIILGPGTTMNYVKSNWIITQNILKGNYYMPAFGIPSLVGIFKLFGADTMAKYWYCISTFVVSVLLVVIWFFATRWGEKTFAFAFALSLLVRLIFGDYANTYDLSQVLTAWAVTVPYLDLKKNFALTDPWYRLWCIMMLVVPPLSCCLFIITRLHSPALFPINMILMLVSFMCFTRKVHPL